VHVLLRVMGLPGANRSSCICTILRERVRERGRKREKERKRGMKCLG
jgi:hypothetical protein